MGAISPSDSDVGAEQRNIPAPPRHPGPDPSGYESPVDGHHFVQEPHRKQGRRAELPHRRNHSAAELAERGHPASHASLNDLVLKARNMRSVGIRDRIACVQWTWFTMTMVCPPPCVQGDFTVSNY